MKDPRKIPYNDGANYAAEEAPDYWDYCDHELFEFPQIYEFERYSYENYLVNHKKILTSPVPFYAFQEKALSNSEFTQLKENVCQRCKEIPTLDDVQYLELITKLALNPIQVYSYAMYENDFELKHSFGDYEKHLTEADFMVIKRAILDEMIQKKLWWPNTKDQERLLAQITPGKNYLYFLNCSRPKEDENKEDGAVEYLENELTRLKNEKAFYERLTKPELTSQLRKRYKEVDPEIEAVEKALKDLRAN